MQRTAQHSTGDTAFLAPAYAMMPKGNPKRWAAGALPGI